MVKNQPIENYTNGCDINAMDKILKILNYSFGSGDPFQISIQGLLLMVFCFCSCFFCSEIK